MKVIPKKGNGQKVKQTEILLNLFEGNKLQRHVRKNGGNLKSNFN